MRYLRNAYRSNPHPWIPELSLSIKNFSGGLNNVEPDNQIGDNEATDCKNMRFVNGLIMEKRFGAVLGNKLLDSEVTYYDIFKPILSKESRIVGTASEVYVDDAQGNLVKLCDVNGTIRGVTFNGKYYFVDGTNLYVYDNSTYYKIINAPIGHLSEAHASGVTTLKLKSIPELLKVGDPVLILGASLSQESNFTTTVSAINKSANIVTIAKALTGKAPATAPVFFYTPYDITHTSGEEIWNSETHIAYYNPCLNELGDVYAGESYLPDSPNVIVTHNSRLFISGDSTQPHGVYMSRTAQTLYFPSGAGISVKPDGQAVIDMVVFDNALIIGRHNDMYALYGSSEYQSTSSTPYYIKQMDVSTGFMSANCGALLNNYYLYLGYDGRFYKLNTPTTYVEYLVTSPLGNKCDIYNEPFTFPKGAKVDVSAVAHNNEVYFAVSHSNSRFVIVYNYDCMSYTYFTGWDTDYLFENENILYFLHNQSGKGYLSHYGEVEEIYKDFSTIPISCVYSTKRFDFSAPIDFKYFKRFMVTSHAFGDISEDAAEIDSDINVFIEVDFTDIDIGVPIHSSLSRYANVDLTAGAQWSSSIYNTRNLFKSQYYNLDIRGRTIKFKFINNNLDQPMRIYDVDILYGMRDVR